ncbi:MAG TPA: hypothetical protein VIF57_10315 [Polyangia bacterium]|jgi:hypothetical protein
MYWSPRQFPSLAGRPHAEQTAIINTAIDEHGRGYRWRFIVLIAAIMAGIPLSHRALVHWVAFPLRLCVELGLVIVVLGGYHLWQTNGTIYAAVKKYLAARNPPAGERAVLILPRAARPD